MKKTIFFGPVLLMCLAACEAEVQAPPQAPAVVNEDEDVITPPRPCGRENPAVCKEE